jgi:uncharacterized membrane protein
LCGQRTDRSRWYDGLDINFAVFVAVVGLLMLASLSFALVVHWVVTVLGVAFLVLVPGYAVVAALFPSGASAGGEAGREPLSRIERLALAIATSLSLTIVVGVALNFTIWSITRPTMLGILGGISLAGGIVALIRRRRTRTCDPAATISVQRRIPAGDTTTAANLAVGIALLVVLVSVTLVAATSQKGETYTEFGLLSKTNNGSFTASGYPDSLSAGNSSTLYFTVENEERRPVSYVVVVQMDRVSDGGTVTERATLDTYRKQVQPGERWQQRDDVTPALSGEDVRLTYLLYRGERPEHPTVENAYRELHVWMDVQSDASTRGTAASGTPTRTQSAARDDMGRSPTPGDVTTRSRSVTNTVSQNSIAVPTGQ